MKDSSFTINHEVVLNVQIINLKSIKFICIHKKPMFEQEKDLISTDWLRKTGSELSVHLPWMLILLHGELRIKFTSLDFLPLHFSGQF